MKSLTAILAVAMAACGAPAAPGPESPAPLPDKPPAVEAANPEMEQILKQLMAGRTAEEQQMIAVSQKHYEIALAYFNKGDFERAKVSAQESVRVWPENIPARKLLSEVGDLIIGRPAAPRAVGEQVAREALVATEQGQLEIQMHVIHGQRFLNARMFESALKEFENAEFKILHLPYEVKTMNELLPKVREGKARAKSSIRD